MVRDCLLVIEKHLLISQLAIISDCLSVIRQLETQLGRYTPSSRSAAGNMHVKTSSYYLTAFAAQRFPHRLLPPTGR